ncbi:hypothetical protein AB0A05_26800 [Streptomyces sp. NPDC046374]|uniref:hypothetical protein n=1 Tax=Streptomyces sp. NPDC046374 TaxID=3154917 RepID=UPI0033E8C841
MDDDKPRVLQEREVGAERYSAFGKVCWTQDGPNEWTDEDKAAAWTVRGELYEVEGHLYDVQGYDSTRIVDGKEVPSGNWAPYRLPRSHSYVRGVSANADHVNDGEGLETKAKAKALARKDAVRRNKAAEAWKRHPATIGPVSFSPDIEVHKLEPGYWELSAFGQRWRRWNPDRPGKGREFPAGAERNSADAPPRGQLHLNSGWDYANWMHRGHAFAAMLNRKTIRLLGTMPDDTDCALCEPGSAWGKHTQHKARVSVAGFESRFSEALCMRHLKGYLLPWRLEHLAYSVVAGSWETWSQMLHEWTWQAAVAKQEQRSHIDLQTRWMAFLRTSRDKKKAVELAEKKKAAAAAPAPIGAGVELARDNRSVSYRGRRFRVVRDGAMWAARDGRTVVCDYLPKAAFARAVAAFVDSAEAQGGLFEAAAV